MRAVDLDFAPRRRPLTAWVLLALALLLAVDAGREAVALRDRLHTAAAPASPPPAAELTAELAAARQVTAHLQRPWAALLGEIENAAGASRSLRLLALEPDGGSGRLRLTGTAEQAAEVHEFVRRLGSGEHLREVHLSYQRPAADRHGVEFALLAHWGPAR